MYPQPNEIVTVEDGNGILHEMVIKSVDTTKDTVTGEVSAWPGGKERGKTVETVTVPLMSIVS